MPRTEENGCIAHTGCDRCECCQHANDSPIRHSALPNPPAACRNPGEVAAADIAALTLSGRVNARYSLAYSGGRISTIVSFSTQTLITWNGPRLQSKHSHPSRRAIVCTLAASVATLSAKCVDP